MSVKYAMLKALVKVSGLKREWSKYSNEGWKFSPWNGPLYQCGL